MNVLRTISYIHIDIQLGAMSVTLYRDGTSVRSATHTTKIRTTLLRDVMSEYASVLLYTCEKAIGTERIDHVQTTVRAPLTYYFEDTTIFQTKKNIPTEDSVIQEIEPLLPTYIHASLGDHARDGVIIQHVPHMLSVRGYEVKYDTNVQPPYDASFVLQWVERTTYEAVRVVAQTYSRGKVIYNVAKIVVAPALVVGVYMSELSLENERNPLPVTFGEKSILMALQDEYSVPMHVVQSHLMAHHKAHSISDRYYHTVLVCVKNAFEEVSYFLNVHSYATLTVQSPAYIKNIVQKATRFFLRTQIIHNGK